MTELIKPSRRGFIAGAVAFIAAPAIVRASSLEYVPRAASKLPQMHFHGFVVHGGDLSWVTAPLHRSGNAPLVDMILWDDLLPIVPR